MNLELLDDGELEEKLALDESTLNILSKLKDNEETINRSDKPFKSFLPEPGFCLKTKETSKERKIFINICQSKEISSPKDISEDELMKLINSEDRAEDAAFQFRIPMSLGEAHDELDNSGNPATAYDVVISSEFFAKINKISSFMGFFMSIVIEGLENKYSIKLDRNCKMLKNRKFMGKIQEHYIRLKSKPLISEVSSDSVSESINNPKIEDSSAIKAEVPKYKIFREPVDGNPQFLVAEIELPKIISSSSLTLEIGEDRILLTTRSSLYFLDIFLPYYLKQEECGAQFDKKSRKLTITMPVKTL